MSSPHSAASTEPDAAKETRRLCESCDHAPFSSNKALHGHRTLHQLRADVTLPDGSTHVVTRGNEASSWFCPEHDCDYASKHLLRLRTHLSDQRKRIQKRRRQEQEELEREEQAANSQGLDEATSPQPSSTPIRDASRPVRQRLNTSGAAHALLGTPRRPYFTRADSDAAGSEADHMRPRLDTNDAAPTSRDHSRPASARVPTSTRRRTEPTNAGQALLVTARRRTETNEAAQALLALGETEEQEGEEDDNLFRGEENDEGSPPPPATPQNLLACSNLYHDAANGWLVCIECRTILSPRTAASHVGQMHQRSFKGLHTAILSLGLRPITQRNPELLSSPPRHLPARATYNCSRCPSAFLSRSSAQAHLRSEHFGDGAVLPGQAIQLSASPRKLAPIAAAASIGPLSAWLDCLDSDYQHATQLASSGPSEPGSLWIPWLGVTALNFRIGLPDLTTEGAEVATGQVQHMLLMRSALMGKEEKEVVRQVESIVGDLIKQCQKTADDYGFAVSMALAQDELDPSVHAPGAQQPLHVNMATRTDYAKHWAGLVLMLLRLARQEDEFDGDTHPLSFLYGNHLYLQHRATLLRLDQHLSRRRRHEQDSPSERGELIDALGLLSVAVIEEEVRGRTHTETGILLLYSSIRAIHVQESGLGEELVRFKTEGEHSHFLSAIIWTGRMLAFNAARTDSTLRGDALADAILTWRGRHLVKSTQRAVPTLLAWRRWTQVVNANSQGSTMIDISSETQTLHFKGADITLASLQSFAMALIDETEARLHAIFDVAGDAQSPIYPLLPPVRLQHSSTFEGSGYGLTHPDVLAPFSSYPDLASALDEGRIRLNVDLDNAADRRNALGRKLLGLEERFLESLLLAIHLTAGNAARGTEILSATVTDGVARPRSVYTGVSRQIYLVFAHSKTQRTDIPGRVIARYLPSSLSDLALRYFILVRPTLDKIFYGLYNNMPSAMLFRRADGSPMDTSRMTDLLRLATEIHGLPLPLGVAEWRQISAALTRIWAATSAERALVAGMEDEEEDAAAVTEQANHSRSTASAWYALSPSDLSNIAMTDLIKWRMASEAWHRLLRVDGGVVAESSVPSPSQRPPTLSEMETALCKLHRLGTRKEIYRSWEQRQAFARLSRYQRESHLFVLPTGAGKTALWAAPAMASRNLVTVVFIPYRALKKQALSSQSHFRIGHFHAPTCRPGRLTEEGPDPDVVVISYDAAVDRDGKLLQGLRKLVRERRLLRIVFDEAHVLLTEANFRTACMNGVRHLVSKLPRVPLMLLTGSLPTSMVSPLLDRFGLDTSATKILTAPTLRRNLKIQTVPLPRASRSDQVHRQCAEIVQDLVRSGHMGRILLLCRTRSYAVEMNSLLSDLRCSIYLPPEQPNKDTSDLDRFLASTAQVLIGTHALATGVDLPGIDVTMHVGVPYSLLDLAQGIGRGARNPGQTGTAYLVDSTRVSSDFKDHQAAQLEVYNFLNSNSCLVAQLSTFLDSNVVSCDELAPDLCCSSCTTLRQDVDEDAEMWDALTLGAASPIALALGSARSAAPLPTSTAAARHPSARQVDRVDLLRLAPKPRVMDSHLVKEEMLKLLARLKDHCLMCLVLGENAEHAADSCRGPQAAAFKYWSSEMQLAPYTACFRCLRPQWLCKQNGAANPECTSCGKLVKGLLYGLISSPLQEAFLHAAGLEKDLALARRSDSWGGPRVGASHHPWFTSTGDRTRPEYRAWKLVWRTLCRLV